MLKNVSDLNLGGNPNGRLKGKDKEVSKFNRVAKIHQNYPELDKKFRSFVSVSGITERKAAAYAVLMMMETGIRIGNEDSAEGYVSKAKATEGQTLKTYGLTTLLREHVAFTEDGKMTLDFVGKKSVEQFIVVEDPLLVAIGKQFHDQGFERWLTLPDGSEITKPMVAKFIKKSVGSGFSPKDFRAFRANIEAARLSNSTLQTPADPASKKKEINEEVKKIIAEVAEILGNTPGIAKKAYINPEILHRHWTSRGFVVDVITKKGKKKEVITKVKS